MLKRIVVPVMFLALVTGPVPITSALDIRAEALATPPTIDGVLDDACWSAARWHTGFSVLRAPDKAPSENTRFAILLDQDFVYIAAEMAESKTDKILARHTEHDGRVFGDDCVQVFLDPDTDNEGYFRLTINSVATVLDASTRLELKWDSDARVAAKVYVAKWCVEVAIPLSALELNTYSRDPWLFNVTRAQRAGGQYELSTFAKLKGNFHDTDHFARLIVPTDRIAEHLWDISEPTDIKICGQGNTAIVECKAQIQNLTGRAADVLVQAEARGDAGTAKGEPVQVALDHEAVRSVNVRAPMGEATKGTLFVSVYDAAKPERLLARFQHATMFQYTPLTITLNTPWYKDTIFATQQIDMVEVAAHSDLPDSVLSNLVMTADIRTGDKVMTDPVRIDRVNRDTIVSIPSADLPVGNYQVRVALADKAGNELHSATVRLRKVPPKKGEVTFDQRMACLVDGKPFVPFGWFGFTDEVLDLCARDGYNTLGAYGTTNSSKSDAELKAGLDKAYRLGLKVLITPHSNLKMYRGSGKPITKTEDKSIRECVRKWRDHPAVLAWYMSDEPEGKGQSLERRVQEFRIVDEEDPYHPCIVLNNTVAGIYKYEPSCDLLMPDVYPGFLQKGQAIIIDRPTKAMVACRKATDGRKPVWITPQAQIQIVDGHRAPTYRELRNQMWQGVAHDATGFFWYRAVFLDNLVASRVGTSYLDKELKAVIDIVRRKSVPDMVSVSPKKAKLSYGAKVLGDDIFVIAVSLDARDSNVSFQVKGLGNRRLLVLSEQRHITPTDGSFTDRFKPYEAHVYTTNLSLTDHPAVADAQAAVDKAFEAMHKPDNLAYHRTGAVAFVGDNTGYAAYLNDGTDTGQGWPQRKAGAKVPATVGIDLAKPASVGRVVVYSGRAIGDTFGKIKNFEVQIRKAGQWETVATTRDNQLDPVEVSFEPKKTQSVRLYITDSVKKCVDIREIEIYASPH